MFFFGGVYSPKSLLGLLFFFLGGGWGLFTKESSRIVVFVFLVFEHLPLDKTSEELVGFVCFILCFGFSNLFITFSILMHFELQIEHLVAFPSRSILGEILVLSHN